MRHIFWSYVVRFCVSLNLVVSANPQMNGVYFNTSGFEDCGFNLALNDKTVYEPAPDVVDRILVNTVGIQGWTIFELGQMLNRSLNYVAVAPFLDKVGYLKEYCSVNIVVAMGNCSEHHLRTTFGRRIFSKLNTFIMLFDISVLYRCSAFQRNGYAFDGRVSNLNVLALYLENNTHVVFSKSYCVTCSVEF